MFEMEVSPAGDRAKLTVLWQKHLADEPETPDPGTGGGVPDDFAITLLNGSFTGIDTLTSKAMSPGWARRSASQSSARRSRCTRRPSAESSGRRRVFAKARLSCASPRQRWHRFSRSRTTFAKRFSAGRLSGHRCRNPRRTGRTRGSIRTTRLGSEGRCFGRCKRSRHAATSLKAGSKGWSREPPPSARCGRRDVGDSPLHRRPRHVRRRPRDGRLASRAPIRR
jgi:hypothetical protein